jgi:hypothetical protein
MLIKRLKRLPQPGDLVEYLPAGEIERRLEVYEIRDDRERDKLWIISLFINVVSRADIKEIIKGDDDYSISGTWYDPHRTYVAILLPDGTLDYGYWISEKSDFVIELTDV